MIGRLTGKLAIKKAPQILIDCQGVGYELDVSMSTFYQLPAEGDPVSLWTHLLIKDDQHALVGFYTDQERGLFRQLIRISGVGPKMALTILSGISESDFALCVQSSDVATLTRLPGVGKKTAERLIMEMKDKLDLSGSGTITGVPGVQTAGGEHSAQDEAVEALLSLGYKATDASRMIKQAAEAASGQTAEQLIKLALQNAIS
jgi:Holliday junction DNA helicase RuvA